jgi:hypothetical protein
LRAASPQGGVSVVRFGEAFLNEGNPPVFYADTLATLAVSPLVAIDPRSVSGNGSEILLSPNPAHDHVLMELPVSYAYGQISLWNIVGQRIEVFSSNRQRINLDVSRFPSGVYILTVEHKPEWTSRLLICR